VPAGSKPAAGVPEDQLSVKPLEVTNEKVAMRRGGPGGAASV